MTERDRKISAKRDHVIPIIQTDKYEDNGIYSPFTFEPVGKLESEVFEIITDNSVPNVVPGRYMISNKGRVWDSYDKRFMPTAYNKKYNEDGTNDGYLKTKLICYDTFYGTYYRDRYIHRMVLSEFIADHDLEENEVNHKDGNKTNNALSNLEWISHEGNISHAIENGLLDHGFLQNISNETIVKICEKLQEGTPIFIISKELNVPDYTVADIKNRSIFKNISSNYSFQETDYSKFGYGYMAGLPNSIVEDICKRLENNESAIKIAESYKIPKQTVYRILNRTYHSDISSKYDFSNYGNAKFTSDEKVHEICRLLQEGKSTKEVVNETGVGRFVIQKIRNGEKYTEISSQYTFPEARKMQDKLSEEKIREICELLQSGESQINTSIKTGIKYDMVQNIKRRISYTSISKDYNF